MKNKEATYKTTSNLLHIARKHFTEYGYFDVSLEKIAEEGNVTRGAVYHHFKNKQGLFKAVMEHVQKDIALHIEKEALKSDDPWQQLILGCAGFVYSANAKENKRILLIDAPAVLGWNDWRKSDKESSMRILQQHITDLKTQGYIHDDVDIAFMTYAISGALNEVAMHYTHNEMKQEDDKILSAISQFVHGFKKSS